MRERHQASAVLRQNQRSEQAHPERKAEAGQSNPCEPWCIDLAERLPPEQLAAVGSQHCLACHIALRRPIHRDEVSDRVMESEWRLEVSVSLAAWAGLEARSALQKSP